MTALARATRSLWLRLGLMEGTRSEADQLLGRRGERAAARLLRRSGYRIIARNARVRIGEADLVCLAPDRTTIVVVEVKTRIARPGGPPPEANIHARKRAKLVAVTRYLARANRWHDRPVRIDVVAVEWPAPGTRARPVLRHYVGAVTARR